MTSKQALSTGSGWLNGATLLEVFEELNPRNGFPNGIISSSRSRPNKVDRLSKGFVTKRLGSVDNVFSISADGNKTSIAIVLNILWVQFTRSKIARNHRKTLSIRQRIIVVSASQSPHGSGLNLIILGPNDLTGSIHRDDRIVRPEFHNHTSFIKTNGKFGSLPRRRQGPCTLHSIIQRRLGPVSGALPQPNGSILRRRTDEGEFRMKQHRADIVRVPIERVHDGFGLIIPNLDGAIVCPRENVGFVPRGIIVHAIDPPLVSFQGVVRHRRSQPPDLDGAIQRRRGEGIGVFGIELDHHDVVRMPLEQLRAIEAPVPVPALDGHVVGTGQKVRQRGVHLHIPDVVGMRLEVLDLLHGVVIVHAQAHVVRRGDEPLFARDEFGAADGQLGDLEGFDVGARFVVPDGHVAGVEGGEGPRFGGVDVHGFDALGAHGELLFDVQADWHFTVYDCCDGAACFNMLI
mmetsp:Transcript_22741/g.46790  ORF Transcript_22741/g.46790 Transcript_22741/m.46790 type:complete len:461 (-) Transcript_22741:119-1501(-)